MCWGGVLCVIAATFSNDRHFMETLFGAGTSSFQKQVDQVRKDKVQMIHG